jgi:acyl dehydratase
MNKIYLDDLSPSKVYDLGAVMLTEKEIVDFAALYDPQPFHVDVEAASASIYGGVIASGWQTVCVFMRLFVDGLLSEAAAMGSPGLDELHWLHPVRPGDRLRARVEVVETRPSRSKPDRGIAKLRCVMTNQADHDVLTFVANVLFRRRETG